MKKYITVILAFILIVSVLAGCGSEASKKAAVKPADEKPETTAPTGAVPKEFESIVQNNLFYGVQAFSDRLLKYDAMAVDSAKILWRITMYDFWGNELAEYGRKMDDYCHGITALTATSDGGFIFALGFYDHAYPDNEGWASDNGVTSYIIKCDKNGELEWETPLGDVEGEALEFCIEYDGNYYFFGTHQVPETKQRGTYSLTDVHMMKLSADGAVLKTKTIGGSDFDTLWGVELTGDKFDLHIRSQSNDGDFADAGSFQGSLCWVFTADGDLEIPGHEKEEDYTQSKTVGFLDGRAVKVGDPMFSGFEDGSVTALLDYGDFYLTVSEHVTGMYEKQPSFINSLWCYTETVYGAYDKEGDLLWKAAVDSSPDFDNMAEQIMGSTAEK